MRIIQVLSTLAYGDAIGNETIALKKLFQEAGYDSEIYYMDGIDSRLQKKVAQEIENMYICADDILIYHLCIGTKLSYKLSDYKCRKIIRYHNITPPYFFEGYNKRLQRVCKEGYKGVKYLSDKADYILADSAYNLNELRKMGYTCKGEVIPVLLDFDKYKRKADEALMKRDDEYVNFLFVGRIAPNKKMEDIIRAFYCYHNYINQKSRLFFVGNYTGMERYYRCLLNYIDSLSLGKSIVFTGHITNAKLMAYYLSADVFVCMSEHEGFCVPLVEAMYFCLPVIAYNSSAIAETVGESGILLNEKNPRLIAEWMNRLVKDKMLRQDMKEKEKNRLQYFTDEHTKKKFLDFIRKFGDEK